MVYKKKQIQKGGTPDTTLLQAVAGILGIVTKVIGNGFLKVIWRLFHICPNPDADPNATPETCFKGKAWDWHLAFKEKHPKAATIYVGTDSKTGVGEFRLLTGPAWRFLIMTIKITLAIAIFCLGGPIVLLGGILFLYTQVYRQLNTRVDDPSKTLNHKNDN